MANTDNPVPGGRAVHLALAERLGLDPHQVTPKGFTITPVAENYVQVEWTGFARLPFADLQQIFEAAQEERRDG